MKRIFPVLITAFAILFSPMPVAFAADTSAPLLVDWTIQTINADISTSPKTVSVKFILSDDSKINEPKLLVKSLETTQLSSFAIVKEVAKSGKLVSYEATATLNVGQSPREWEWVLYPLTDEFGNTNNTFGPGTAWAGKFIVFDKTYTIVNYNNIRICLSGLRAFNRALTRFFEVQKYDTNNVQFSVLKLKFSLPESIIDEKQCETDTERITRTYGPNQAVEFSDALGPIADAIDIKNAMAAAAARDAKDKAAADKVAADFLARQKAAADKVAALKKTTITCVKGKLTKKVTAVKPKCPPGYKVKK